MSVTDTIVNAIHSDSGHDSPLHENMMRRAANRGEAARRGGAIAAIMHVIDYSDGKCL